jgi:NADPH:quinone reductase-like Zn-dependent oxidoreductase
LGSSINNELTIILSTEDIKPRFYDMSSSDKTALVTGSTSGIGLACAHALAKRGINIVITGSRDESLVKGIITDIEGYMIICY